jgi:hypothetical protein
MWTFGHLMAKIYKHRFFKNTRLCVLHGLVFFLLADLQACHSGDTKISLVWKNEQATGITIPKDIVKGAEKDVLKVTLSGAKNKQGIFGDFTTEGNTIVYHPLIPLSPGLSYDIWQRDKLVGTVKVPPNTGKAPQLLSIYPQQDTVPENLLKFYFHFSKPMRTGEVLQHVYILDHNKDTLHNVFLNLQPELWDTTGTVLTLWLDPGRIKRDLVLNRELGNPLKKAQTYQLIISPDWKDNRGLALGKPYTKHFTAGDRDGEIPDINNWQLSTPKAGTDEPLIIKTAEPLDHYLLEESVSILNAKGKILHTHNVASDKDRTLNITPTTKWQPGKYRLQVKANLEDLAGNNLNRVFDRDIRKDKQQNHEFFEQVFEVK